MSTDLLKNKYDLKELELNALLEVTQAINSNLSEADLYKIYHFTLRANLQIKKLALFVLDEAWDCKVNFGTAVDFSNTTIDANFLEFDEITILEKQDKVGDFAEFEVCMPVLHKAQRLAFVFLEGAVDVNFNFIQALTNIIIVAIENKKMARNALKQEALNKEMEIAREVQNFLFPETLPNEKGLEVEASYIPHQLVGGDYYDYIPIDDDRFLICIADVSGKGVPAAILMSNFQASLRTLVRQVTDITTIVHELNHQIMRSANGENFITFFGGIYDKQKKTFTYINAGHNPPMLICQEKQIHLLEKGTTILGSFDPLPFIEKGEIMDLQNFLFFGYTDGLTETMNTDNEEFGTKKVQDILFKNQEGSLKTLHEHMLSAVDDFRGEIPYFDDITMLSCRVENTTA